MNVPANYVKNSSQKGQDFIPLQVDLSGIMSDPTEEDINRSKLLVVDTLEKIIEKYLDHLEATGERIDFQNDMMSFILSACYNIKYRIKLYNSWTTVSSPDQGMGWRCNDASDAVLVSLSEMLQYLEDCEKLKAFTNYDFPEMLCRKFVDLKLDKDVRILDVACGPGNVAKIVSSCADTWPFNLSSKAPPHLCHSSRSTDTPTSTAWIQPRASSTWPTSNPYTGTRSAPSSWPIRKPQ